MRIFLVICVVAFLGCCLGVSVFSLSLTQSAAMDYSIRMMAGALAIGTVLIFVTFALFILAYSMKPAASGYTMYRFGKSLPGIMDKGQGIEAPGYRVLPHGAGRAFPISYDSHGRPTGWELASPARSPNTISSHGEQGGSEARIYGLLD